MGSTDVALLGVLIFMALGLSWFALKVNMMLWRLGAALVWLSIGILLWTNTLGSDVSDPWTYVLALALLVMIIAVLMLQVKTDVRHEASARNKSGLQETMSFTSYEKKKKRTAPTSLDRQAAHKARLRGGR